MITLTWDARHITLWRGHHPIHRVQLHGRDPYMVLNEVRELLKTRAPLRGNVVRIDRKAS